MRHSETLVEVASEVGIRREQCRRALAGQSLAVPDEVRLIVVAAVESRSDPFTLRVGHRAKDLVKTLHPAEQLGRESNRGQKSPFELPQAHAQLAGQLREIASTRPGPQALDGRADLRIFGTN